MDDPLSPVVAQAVERAERVARGLSAKTQEQLDEWTKEKQQRLAQEAARMELERAAIKVERARQFEEQLRIAQAEEAARAEKRRIEQEARAERRRIEQEAADEKSRQLIAKREAARVAHRLKDRERRARIKAEKLAAAAKPEWRVRVDEKRAALRDEQAKLQAYMSGYSLGAPDFSGRLRNIAESLRMADEMFCKKMDLKPRIRVLAVSQRWSIAA